MLLSKTSNSNIASTIFLKNFLKIVIMYKHIVMIEIIFFILHVRHGLKSVRNFII